MRTPMTIPAILALAVFLIGEPAGAQGISIFQGSDGSSGTIVDLGGGIRSYSDSHGTTGTILDLGGGLQTYQFTSPGSGFKSGTILTFPSPRADVNAPPAGLTPAPVLPFFPKSSIMPRQQAASAPSFGPDTHDGTVGEYGTRRFGR